MTGAMCLSLDSPYVPEKCDITPHDRHPALPGKSNAASARYFHIYDSPAVRKWLSARPDSVDGRTQLDYRRSVHPNVVRHDRFIFDLGLLASSMRSEMMMDGTLVSLYLTNIGFRGYGMILRDQ